jgi:ubiquinone/menaquinone biosynthesis C-methylase UbiE
VRHRLRRAARTVLFRYGWDTRSRHQAAAAVLREATAEHHVGDGPVLLDVGCGRAGIAAFLPPVEVMGTDREPPAETLPNRPFTRASIDELPFADSSFPYVSCIDVLQELPLDVRERGVAEMVRVAREGLVIVAPQGQVADRADADFERALRARGAPVPPWVRASRANPYPTVAGVVGAIRRAEPCAAISATYAEPVRLSRLLRAVAVRSSAGYAVANLMFGLLSPLIPTPHGTRAYRMFVVARLGGGAGCVTCSP